MAGSARHRDSSGSSGGLASIIRARKVEHSGRHTAAPATRRSAGSSGRAASTVSVSSPPASRSASPALSSKLSKRRGVVNVAMMTAAAGLVATVALPSYAVLPGANASPGTGGSRTSLSYAQSQSVRVDGQAKPATVSNDNYSADAGATARANALSQMGSYATGAALGVPLATGVSATGANFAQFAVAKFAGIRYVLGGESMSGVDCSGLVKLALASFGIGVAHNMVAEKNLGTKVSSPEPGDLLVFNGGTHIGIYVGGGQVFHAPYEGAVSRVQKLWGDPYVAYRIFGG